MARMADPTPFPSRSAREVRADDDPAPDRARGQLGAESQSGWEVLLALAMVLLVAVRCGAESIGPTGPWFVGPSSSLRVEGRHFVDPAGRVVLLRGVNLSGGAKVPPFSPVGDLADLDRLPPLGMNVIRLVFIWEAYEPTPGGYDESYLAWIRWIAEAAWARGLFVIVDIHQDGFSRFSSRGSGDGFPSWALSSSVDPVIPDNGPGCKNWPILVATDPGMHRSFRDFYADAEGVRTRYLLLIARLAETFAGVPGVIGYDLLNEPWGDESDEIAPLYRDAARVIRGIDPDAILFLEGHITTNSGLQTRLPRPSHGGVAYAPHYYKPTAILLHSWHGGTVSIDRAFAHMGDKAAEWCVPLFLGEFGVPAGADRAGDYVDALYDRLDARLASGTQWNFTPSWDPIDKDGWNGEDFNILCPDGGPARPNFVPRPYPRATAGLPLHFRFRRADGPGVGPVLEFAWEHRPDRGETELYVPSCVFPPHVLPDLDGPGVECRRDEARQLLIVTAAGPGLVRVRLLAR